MSRTPEEIVEEAMRFHWASDWRSALAVLEDGCAAGGKAVSEHPKILLRLGVENYMIGNEFEDNEKDAAQPYFDKGLQFCTQAKEKNPADPDCHTWWAVALAGTVKHQGPKVSISKAYEVHDCFKKAIELDPKNAFALHCLGAWCYEVSQIGWLARQAASILFATPPTSSLEDALKNLQLAEDVDQTKHEIELFWNRGYLALTLYKLKDYKSAALWMDEVKKFDAKTQRQIAFKNKVLEKRSKCG